MRINGVLQTRDGIYGNCYAACVATVFKLRLDQVPDIRWSDKVPVACEYDAPTTIEQDKETIRITNEWMSWYRERGLTVWRCSSGVFVPKEAVNIGGVKSPRGFAHAVVCLGREIVWDPHPDQNAYDIKLEEHEIFIALDPSKMYGTRQ